MHDLNWSIYFVKLEYHTGNIKYIQDSAGIYVDDMKTAKIYKTRKNAEKIVNLYNKNRSDELKASVVEVKLFEVT
jgi:Zn-finger protein